METLDPTMEIPGNPQDFEPPHWLQELPQEEQEVELSADELALIKLWQDRIVRAKAHWQDDFKRMRENMRFVSGLQWPGQAKVAIDKYVANVVLRLVNQKVASLYAKNPTAVATPRKRINYTMWDGEVDSLIQAAEQAQAILQTGKPLPPDLSMFFADIEAGKLKEKLVKRVGEALEIVYQYSVDSQKPEFKNQLKQCVRRTIITCCAFGRPVFCRDQPGYAKPFAVEYRSGPIERAARAQNILHHAEEIQADSATVGTLKSLAMGLGANVNKFDFPERLDFDFPTSTSIIVDPACRSLVDFVGARWLVQEYELPVEEINSIFGTDIESTSQDIGIINTNDSLKPNTATLNGPSQDGGTGFFENGKKFLWEVFDKTTETRFFICDGYMKWVLPPETPTPSVSGFWQHYSLVFNEIEVAEKDDNGAQTSIYPPSDVQTMMSPQREWNRTREDLRDQRRANAPVWMCRKGMLTSEDKEKIANALPNEVIEIEGIPPDMPMEKFFIRRPVAPIDPSMYDTAPLEQDIMLAGGMQQANLGPAQPNVTATVGSIAEQSRMTVSASNVDDLDGFLSRLAQAGGEMLLQEMSPDTVKLIAGDGAIWPSQPQTRAQFLNEVFLKIEAASSGRPNKAIDVANGRDLLPLILNAGGNPIGVVDELAKRLGDNIDVTKFFPLLPPQGVLAPGGEGPQANSAPTASASNGAGMNPTSPAPAMAGGNDGGASNAQVSAI